MEERDIADLQIRKNRIIADPMYTNSAHLIEELGGYRSVAQRLGVGATTMHDHMQRPLLPSKFYLAFCALAHELQKPMPQPGLFAFVPLEAKAA